MTRVLLRTIFQVILGYCLMHGFASTLWQALAFALISIPIAFICEAAIIYCWEKK